jgi:D-arabinose 1-dehydrogenase-like Zn-dependent alcohol dehydrogenase
MDAGSVELVPEGLDPVEAAPLFCAGFTVYSGMCDAQLRPGDRCAVIGMGGLGHLAVQYAAALGAEVVAVTRSAGKQAALKNLGADHIVLTNGSDPGDCLRRIGGADVIVHTGNGVEPGLLRGLRPFGRLSLVGVSPDVLAITPIEMIFDKVTIYGSCQGPRHRLREVLELHKRAKAKTVVEAYPLERALDAYERVASGTTRFRAVLVP